MGIFDRGGFRVISRGTPLGGVQNAVGGILRGTGLGDGMTEGRVATSTGAEIEFQVPNQLAKLSREEIEAGFSNNGTHPGTHEGSPIIGRYGADGELFSIALPMVGKHDKYVVFSGEAMESYMRQDPAAAAIIVNDPARAAAAQQAAAPAEAEAEAPADPQEAADAPPADDATADNDTVAVVASAGQASAIEEVELPPSSAAPAADVNAEPAAQSEAVAAPAAVAQGQENASVAGKLTVHANNGDAMQRYETADGGHVYIFSDGTNMTGAMYVPEGAMGDHGTYYSGEQLANIPDVRLADGKVLSDGSVQTVSNTISGGTVDVAAAQAEWARNSFGANATPEAYQASLDRSQTFADRIDLEGIRSDPDAVSAGNIAGADQDAGVGLSEEQIARLNASTSGMAGPSA